MTRNNRAAERSAERKELGLSVPDYLVFKLHEWIRLYGSPPSATDWNPSQARHACGPERMAEIEQRQAEHLWPSGSTAVLHFGSWNGLMEAAGIQPLAPGQKRHYRQRWQWAEEVDRLREQELAERVAELWREDQLWQLPPGVDEHRPVVAIAEQLGESPGRVLSIAFGLREQGVELPKRQLVSRPPSVSDRIRLRRERVALLWREGKPAAEIAEELGVSYSTVTQDAARLRREGVDIERRGRGPRRRLLPDERGALVLLAEQGWPIERIARAVSLPVDTVERVLVEHQREQDSLIARRARVRVMNHAGIPVEEIGRRLGVPESVVRADLDGDLERVEQDARWSS